jgi:hypothetical protein
MIFFFWGRFIKVKHHSNKYWCYIMQIGEWLKLYLQYGHVIYQAYVDKVNFLVISHDAVTLIDHQPW